VTIHLNTVLLKAVTLI